MLNKKNIKTSSTRSFDAQEVTLNGVSEIQYLYVPPRASIEKHTHEDQWELIVHLAAKTVYVTLKNEEHEVINESGHMLSLMVIHGNSRYSFEDFKEFFENFGFSVLHESVNVPDNVVSL